MKRILIGVALCLTLAQSVQAQGPVWGAFHSIHTTVSDGTESLSQRTDNLRMDYEWFQTIDEVNAYQSLSDFVYFVGYEWMGTGSNYAEITAFFTGDTPSVKVNGDDPNYDTFEEFATWLSQNNGIGCINHPALYSPVNWSDAGVQNEQIFPCVEMLNRHHYQWSDQWICAEGSGCTTYGNPSPPTSADWRGAVKNALDNGLRLGFVAGWDYHDGYPGTPTAYTGLVGVTEWTKEAVVETVKKRHTWAAEDRILMNVTSDPYIMGDAFVASGQLVPIDYHIWAAPGKTITQVSIFVDGIITEVHRFSGQENTAGWFEVGLSATEHYVFIEAIQSDGKRAWSSPMYITAPGLCNNVTTWEGRVGAYSDDAEEALNGEVLLTSTDLELINDSEWRGEQIVGLRFNGPDIPKGATVLNAYIQFRVDETSSETTSLRIAGEDVDHAATFRTSAKDISSRVRTEAEVVWTPATWTTVGEAGLNQRTPDLSSIIYEIINRPGWTPGNSMTFLIAGTGKRVAVAYDGDRYGAPFLHVEYGSECADNNPIPSITTLNPVSAIARGPALMLTVNGSGFLASSVVRWNGADRTTTFASSTQLTAAIPASDIAVTGTAQVTVFSPAPGGGPSNVQTFTVNNPVPTTTSLNPPSATAGISAFTLTVNGSDFVTSSVVRWNGADRVTTWVSSTQLLATILASDIAVSGTAQLTVFNPSPGGGISSTQTFTITVPDNPVPTTTILSPSSAAAGGTIFTLTVNGTNFILGSVVRWNGADRTTTFVSSTQLTAAIPASDITVSGTAQVTAFSPAPGGGTSNAQIFTINQSVPMNMHIGDLDGTSRPAESKWWNAIVAVTVHDENHNSVQKATVKGTWSGPIAATSSCTTDTTGSCSITSNKVKSSSSTVTFTVTNVTHSSLRYSLTDNHDPDGESNGTAIVVLKSW
jgi:hypothetical protein